MWEPPAGAKPFTFNSTELRAISVPIEEVKPVGGRPVNLVQRASLPRRAAQAGRNLVRGILRAVHEQPAPSPELLWEIAPADENLILERCCP